MEAADASQHRRQTQLEGIKTDVGPHKADALIEALNALRDSCLSEAANIASEHPDQYQRYLDGLRALATSIGSISSRESRPVQRGVTMLRKAVTDIGCGKFINYRTGKQEDPED